MSGKEAGYPSKIWQVDTVGPTIRTRIGFPVLGHWNCYHSIEGRRNNRYLLTIIDFLTRYAIALPLKDQTADAVVRALVEQVFTKYGVPEVIISDRGTNFTSDKMSALTRELAIRHNLTTAYHPAKYLG